MKKKKLTTLELSLFIIPALIIATPFLLRGDWTMESPLLYGANKTRRHSCAVNLKQISFGILQYSHDNDERLPIRSYSPPLFSGNDGWVTSLYPYKKSIGIYQCAGEPTSTVTVPNLSGYTDYCYNGNLSSALYKSIRYRATTLMLGDGSDGIDVTDSRYSKTSLSSVWLSDRSKPPWRHLGGANYAFVDGHVKWLRPHEVLHFSGRANAFSLK